MTPKDFQVVLDNRIALIRQVLDKKASEYSSEEDRLENFKVGAKFIGTTPSAICLSYMTKHLVSLSKMVEDESSGQKYKKELWQEKVGDAINYLILLEALILESRPI